MFFSHNISIVLEGAAYNDLYREYFDNVDREGEYPSSDELHELTTAYNNYVYYQNKYNQELADEEMDNYHITSGHLSGYGRCKACQSIPYAADVSCTTAGNSISLTDYVFLDILKQPMPKFAVKI